MPELQESLHATVDDGTTPQEVGALVGQRTA